MKTSIYFVRHAQPDISIRQDDVRPLSGKGLKDSRLVTKYLLDKNIAAIYSSPYKRAGDTVRNLAKTIELPVIIVDDFRERAVGVWVEDFKEYSRRQWTDFSYQLDNGESLGETQKRNIAALQNVLEDNQGKSIAIGTHGTALSTIINYYRPDFGYEGFWRMADKMPFIVCFRFDGGEFESLEEIELMSKV